MSWTEILKQIAKEAAIANMTKEMEGPIGGMVKSKLGGGKQTESELTGSQEIADMKGLKDYGTEQLETRGMSSFRDRQMGSLDSSQIGSSEIGQMQLENAAKAELMKNTMQGQQQGMQGPQGMPQGMQGPQGLSPQVAQQIQQQAQQGVQQPQGPFGFAQGLGHGIIGQPSQTEDPSVWWRLGQTIGQTGRSRMGAPTADTTPLETQQREAQQEFNKWAFKNDIIPRPLTREQMAKGVGTGMIKQENITQLGDKFFLKKGPSQKERMDLQSKKLTIEGKKMLNEQRRRKLSDMPKDIQATLNVGINAIAKGEAKPEEFYWELMSNPQARKYQKRIKDILNLSKTSLEASDSLLDLLRGE